MLLNIGPRPEGRISDPDVDRLRDLGLWMMLYGEAVRGIRPWVVTNEGDVWLTKRPGENTVYAMADLEYGFGGPKPPAPSGRQLTLKSVKATPQTKISVLSQAGECEWKEDSQGLHVTVYRKQTVQLIRKPPKLKGGEKASAETVEITWGPDWPVAIKMANVLPVEKNIPTEK